MSDPEFQDWLEESVEKIANRLGEIKDVNCEGDENGK